MYDLGAIQTKFFTDKLLTFKSSLNSSTGVLDSDLTGVSASKRYFNTGVNPVISIENIEAFQPLLSGFTIGAYAAGTTYTNYLTTFLLSNVVTSGGNYYISVADANVGNAVSETAYWKQTTLLSLILKDKIRTSIETVLSDLITPNFLEDNVYMFRIADTTDDLITNADKLVGFRINPVTSDHLTFLINQIGLDFEQSETITFYLYNQNTQVSTFSLTSTAKRFEWHDITQIEITSNTGAWYLFYDQSELSGSAIGANTLFHDYMYRYANITPFQVDSVDDFADFDEGDLYYDRNYGLNLNFSISYSMTNFIKQHMNQFAECFQRQFEFDMIEMFAYNPEAESDLRERNINPERLFLELKSYEGDTVVRKLASAKKRMKATIGKLGFADNAFSENEDDNYEIGSV
jgi:hypothetical protein